MSDQNERTEQEREAARLAREQARARRASRPDAEVAAPGQPRASGPARIPLAQDTTPFERPAVAPTPAPTRTPAPPPVPAPAPAPRTVTFPPAGAAPAPSRRAGRSAPPPLIVDSPGGESPVPPRPGAPRGRGRAGGPPRQPRPPRRSGTGGQPRPPRRGRGHLRSVRLVFAGVLLIIVIAIIWFLVSLFQPFAGSGKGSGSVRVTIPADASTSDIASLLAKDKVVSSSFFFRLRAELGGDHFRAGGFTLAHGMSYGAALKVLTRIPTAAPTENVTIIPGKSRYQLTQLLHSQHVPGNYAKATVKSALLNPRKYGAPKHTPSLEGFLYPDTYQVRKPLKISELVADQLKQFKTEMASVNLKYAKSKNLTAYDVLTIASLEVAEAAKPSDLPKVASVIYNRLRLGMDLGLDTTAAYASNNYSGNLTNKQLNSSSPWNTLNHQGLPPTPINSPDITAIKAAARPAHTDYLYFIVKVCGNGALNFTASYDQFLTWSRQYADSLAKKGAQKTEFCKSAGGG